MCREWNKRLSAEQAQKMYEQAVKLEQEFGEYFTGTVHNYIVNTKYVISRYVMCAYCSINNKATFTKAASAISYM